MGRSESQRHDAGARASSAIRERAAADERRRRYDAFVRDKEANQRAREEFAQISQRQLYGAPARIDLDDAVAEQRRTWSVTLQAQPGQEARTRPTT